MCLPSAICRSKLTCITFPFSSRTRVSRSIPMLLESWVTIWIAPSIFTATIYVLSYIDILALWMPPVTDFTVYSSPNFNGFVSFPNRDILHIVKESSVWVMFRMSTNLFAACAARSGTPYILVPHTLYPKHTRALKYGRRDSERLESSFHVPLRLIDMLLFSQEENDYDSMIFSKTELVVIRSWNCPTSTCCIIIECITKTGLFCARFKTQIEQVLNWAKQFKFYVGVSSSDCKDVGVHLSLIWVIWLAEELWRRIILILSYNC